MNDIISFEVGNFRRNLRDAFLAVMNLAVVDSDFFLSRQYFDASSIFFSTCFQVKYSLLLFRIMNTEIRSS